MPPKLCADGCQIIVLDNPRADKMSAIAPTKSLFSPRLLLRAFFLPSSSLLRFPFKSLRHSFSHSSSPLVPSHYLTNNKKVNFHSFVTQFNFFASNITSRLVIRATTCNYYGFLNGGHSKTTICFLLFYIVQRHHFPINGICKIE